VALFKKKERFLGIDISPSAIKLMELSRSGQRYQVEAMAVEPLPDGVMEDRNPTALDQIGAIIKRALKSSGTSLKKAAVAVPTSSVITRTIPMPADYGEDEIELNIQIEAAQYIPFPLEEIHLDFQMLGPSRNNEGMQDVMIVASRRENVDLREEALNEAGLKTVVVDVEAYALENIYPFMSGGAGTEGGDALTAVIDLGSTITTLYVLQSEKVIFTREQSFGGEQLTQAIADTYNMTKEQAELAKRSGEVSEDYPAAVLEPFKQSVASQIDNALQFFFSSSHYNSVDKIIMVGGVAMIPGLDQVVSTQLTIPTMVGNPFENMESAKRVNRRSLERDAPLFAVACGLAMRSLD
jgi:type IV pilus assembly protein PilM